jgi:hypothetical protein
MTEKSSRPTSTTPRKRRSRKRSYSTSRQVRERYGGRSQMWLWRKLKYDPKFPRPLLMGKNLHLFDDEALDSYDDALRTDADGEVA